MPLPVHGPGRRWTWAQYTILLAYPDWPPERLADVLSRNLGAIVSGRRSFCWLHCETSVSSYGSAGQRTYLAERSEPWTCAECGEKVAWRVAPLIPPDPRR